MSAILSEVPTQCIDTNRIALLSPIIVYQQIKNVPLVHFNPLPQSGEKKKILVTAIQVGYFLTLSKFFSKYCHDPGVVIEGTGMTNFNLGHISVITVDIYLEHNMFTIKRATYTIKEDNAQCILARIMPLFLLKLFHYPAPAAKQGTSMQFFCFLFP